jgi:protein TonB
VYSFSLGEGWQMAGRGDANTAGRRERDARRAFVYALAASLAGHALVVLTVPALSARAARIDVPPPLVAYLMQEAPQPATKPAAPRRAAAAPAPSVEHAQAPKLSEAPAPRPEPPPVAKTSAVAPLPVPAAPPAPAAAEPAPVAAAAVQPVQVAVAASAAAAAPAERKAAPAALDAVLVDRYRSAVMGAANRYKRYPRIAQENNWQGRVEVTLRLRANGSIASLDIKKSAGYEALDRQALDMIREANSRTPLPEVLRGREFAIDIPVVFSLRDPST